jgi:subtilisin family serine protease
MDGNNKNGGPHSRGYLGWVILAFAAGAGCTPAPDGSAPSAGAQDAAPPAVSTPALPPPPLKIAIPGEFLVKFKTSAGSARASKVLLDQGLRVARSFQSVPGLRLVRAGGAAADAEKLSQALAGDPAVEYVEPNYVVRASVVPNDPRFPDLWALRNTGQTGGSSPFSPDISAETAWDITTGSDEVVVAVIDSGVDYLHEDLAANIFANPGECTANGVDDDGNGFVDDCHGIDTFEDDSDPMDVDTHGTHVAGTIGAVGNNGIGVTGVAWRVKILPCRFLDDHGEGSTADAIACFDYLAMMRDRGVNIIASNNSWGSDEYSRALEDAIVAQRQRGMLVVTAAGNSARDVEIQPAYPCAHDVSNVICVAATYEGAMGFSNIGAGVVHLGAPGTGILSTVPGNQYVGKDGTSMAAPHVTGALVLLKAQDPARDWRALKNLVIAGAVPPREYSIRSVSKGRLNLQSSLTCTNSVVLGRLKPVNFEPLHRPVGATILLRALNIRCGAPNGTVPVTVSPTGEVITLLDNGVAPDDFAGDGVYSGRWITPSSGEYELSFPTPTPDNVSVRVDEMLEPGFPVRTDTRTSFDDPPGRTPAALAVGNLDADPDLEIVFSVPHYGPIFALNPDASELPGFPIHHNSLTTGLTLGQFDADGALEILANNYVNGLFAFDSDGRSLPGWPQYPGRGELPPPTVDVDGDGRDEVVAYPLLRGDGTVFSAGIPARAPNDYGPFAIADLDADGNPDFVAPSGGNLRGFSASSRDGLLPHFPVTLPADAALESTPYLLTGDVDGDGAPNIVASGYRRAPTGEVTRETLIFSNRGQLLRRIFVPDGSVYNSLADMDGDGIPEIIGTSHNLLHVWKGDGTPLAGWPVSIAGADFAGTTQPVIGDVDGDGHPDIVVGARFAGGKALQAIRHDGTSVAGFPKNFYGEGGSLNTPAIADIDRDGRNEIVIAAIKGNGVRDTIFVFDTHAPGVHGPVEWPQYLGGPDHHAHYDTGKSLPNHAYLATQIFGAGDVISADGGIGCGANCMHRYARGSQVALSAMPRSGAVFTRWRGACAGQGNPCTLQVDRFAETSADFASPLEVTIAGTGSATVTSDVPGISCSASCSSIMPARARVTLTATPAAGTAFTGWEGACSGAQATCTVVIDDAKHVVARFTNHLTLTVNKTGTGDVTITSSPAGLVCGAASCSGEFTPGSTVALTITAAANSYLSRVNFPFCNIFVMPCQVTMTAPQVVEVRTELKPVVTASTVGGGSVRSDPSGLDCPGVCVAPLPVGLVTLHAIPAPGMRFVRWEGACSGSLSFCNFYNDHDRSQTAVFEPEPRLTIDFSGTGSGTVNASGTTTCSTDCVAPVSTRYPLTLTAAAAAGSTFNGWSGACSGTSPTCELTVAADTTVGVTFTTIAPPPASGSGSSSGGGKGGGRYGWIEVVMLALALGASRRVFRSLRAPAAGSASRKHRADRIERRPRRDVQRAPIRAAKRQAAGPLGYL